MRRTSWIPMALLALAMAGCEGPPTNDIAGMRGISDLEQVGDYIFVASSHRSELRVIDTKARPELGREVPGFVRAPNPISLLSIPVIDRPLVLTADVHFSDEGEEIRGPYLYVQGSGAREISVVGAAPDQLREVARLSTSGPVTAITGVGPASEGDPSTLIFAETVGGAARLYSTQLGDVASLDAAPASVPLQQQDGTPAYWPGETVAAMLTLPRAENGDLRIVVAFRSESGASGRTELVTLDPTGATYVDAPVLLDFGRPVRALRTHALVTRTETEGDDDDAEEVTREILPAGARIFGALDEAACEVVSNCSGIVAVDAITLDRGELPALTLGQRALDLSGEPMMTLQTDGDLLLDFQVMPGLRRLPLRGSARGVRMDLGGVMSTGRGYYTIFDASGLVLINVSEDRPSIVTSTVGYFNADGESVDAPLTGTITQLVSNQTTRLNHGVVQTENIVLTYQGTLPGLRDLEVGENARNTLSPDGVVLHAPSLATRLRVGDEVEGKGDPGCPEAMVVDALDEATGEVLLTPVPTEACATLTFSAGAADLPWVVTGARSGWLGRANAGEVFESVEGVPFARTDTYVPGAPQLRFNFVLPSSLVPSRGEFLLFQTLDGFVPQQSQIKASATSSLAGWPPATSLLLSPETLDFNLGSVWAAIPTQNMVVGFAPTTINPNSPILTSVLGTFY